MLTKAAGRYFFFFGFTARPEVRNFFTVFTGEHAANLQKLFLVPNGHFFLPVTAVPLPFRSFPGAALDRFFLLEDLLYYH